ncbi:MAG: hypothetical protein QG653_266 [Patescibacteria group bacterium]|nr:hypothetical protein [Patescibacteria group bacterium]
MKLLPKSLDTPQMKLVLGLVAVIVLVLAYYFYVTGTRGQEPVGVVEVTQTDHVRGNPTAKVTLVEFADFQCPACAVYEGLIQKVLADNPQDLKVVFRHFPLMQIHKNALISAKASEAASVQGKFWEMHDLLFVKQAEWSGALNASSMMVTYATSLGLDAKKFEADLKSEAIEKKVMAEYQEAIRLKLPGTPSFFLNGKLIDSPRSPEEFNELIKKAKAQ